MKKLLTGITAIALLGTPVFAMSVDDVELYDLHVSCHGQTCTITGKIENNSNEDLEFVKLNVYFYKDLDKKTFDYCWLTEGGDSTVPANTTMKFKCWPDPEKGFSGWPVKVKIILKWQDSQGKRYSKTYEEYP